MSTAPGVDQAVMIGIRYRQARMSEVIAMPKHNAAAHDACCVGVAPTARAASTISRIVLAKPTMTAAAAEKMIPNQPLRWLSSMTVPLTTRPVAKFHRECQTDRRKP